MTHIVIAAGTLCGAAPGPWTVSIVEARVFQVNQVLAQHVSCPGCRELLRRQTDTPLERR